MKLAMIALNLLAGAPVLSGTASEKAVTTYQSVVSGQRQLSDLTPEERLELLQLQQLLQRGKSVGAAETKQQCEDRLGSRSPTELGQALLSLKCSQRPVEKPSN